MKSLLTLASSAVTALFVLSAAAGAPGAKPFVPHQEPSGIGNLVAPGDRVALRYDAPGFKFTKGAVYVRDDRQVGFTRLSLKHVNPPSSALQARVPTRLLRGQRLLYYAVIRDARSGRSARVPASGTSAAWILQRPIVVRLGSHRFGHTRAPGATVARAATADVAWQIPPAGCGCGPSFGPQTFLVGRDGWVWLADGLANRLLGWRPGHPQRFVRTVPLPDRSADRDVALGPRGSFYVTGGEGRGVSYHDVLYRLDATGRVLWKSRLAGDHKQFTSFVVGANSSLRTGPDGTLFLLVGMPGMPGGEFGWMPVATSAGRPLGMRAQRRGTYWPQQPVARGLHLISETYTANVDAAPHEARYALIDRHGRLVRAWRVLSKTDINFDFPTPALVGGDPVVVLDASAQAGDTWKIEYTILRLGPHGLRAQFSLPRAVFGDNLLADVRIGADGRLYQLATSPETGVAVYRYSLGAAS